MSGDLTDHAEYLRESIHLQMALPPEDVAEVGRIVGELAACKELLRVLVEAIKLSEGKDIPCEIEDGCTCPDCEIERAIDKAEQLLGGKGAE